METLGIRTTPEELKLMVSEIDENGCFRDETNTLGRYSREQHKKT